MLNKNLYYICKQKMKIEEKKQVLWELKKNYALIRDEDGEILCLIGRDNEGYYVYFMEHCNITKQEAEALLDKAAWIKMIPVIDERAVSLYREKLNAIKWKMEKKQD